MYPEKVAVLDGGWVGGGGGEQFGLYSPTKIQLTDVLFFFKLVLWFVLLIGLFLLDILLRARGSFMYGRSKPNRDINGLEKIK